MTCAMHLHDPCVGGVALYRLSRGVRVPLCEKHVDAWDTDAVPFAHQSDEQRENWAKWAADRAARQQATQPCERVLG